MRVEVAKQQRASVGSSSSLPPDAFETDQTYRAVLEWVWSFSARPRSAEEMAAQFRDAGVVAAVVGTACAGPVLVDRARAAVGHALAYTTWRSLTREQELTDDQAVALMCALVEGATR